MSPQTQTIRSASPSTPSTSASSPQHGEDFFRSKQKNRGCESPRSEGFSDGAASVSTASGSDRDSSVSPKRRDIDGNHGSRGGVNFRCKKRKPTAERNEINARVQRDARSMQGLQTTTRNVTAPRESDTSSDDESPRLFTSVGVIGGSVKQRRRKETGEEVAISSMSTVVPTVEPSATSDAIVSSTPTAATTPKFEPLEYNIPMCIYMTLIHILATIALFYITSAHSKTLWFAFTLWPISGLGITAGCHRLWAHRSYKAHFIVRLFLMICNSIANQKSIFHWARDHRVHHLYSDTDADPHDSRRGLFFSHAGWLFYKKAKAVIAAGSKIDLSDLRADSCVMFQKKVDPYWNSFFCFFLPALFANYFWNESLLIGFLIPGVLRYVYVLHCTWSVNSLVHWDWKVSMDMVPGLSMIMEGLNRNSVDGGVNVATGSENQNENNNKFNLFGIQAACPYDPKEPPAESRLVAFLAMGEGWHSWHHAFAYCYACAEMGSLEQWNPTKMFIDALYHLGLVWDRKTGHRRWEQKKQQMRDARPGEELIESKSGPPLFKIRDVKFVSKDE